MKNILLNLLKNYQINSHLTNFFYELDNKRTVYLFVFTKFTQKSKLKVFKIKKN